MIRNISRKILNRIFEKFDQLKEGQSEKHNDYLYYVKEDVLYLPCLIRNNAAYYIITETETVYKKSFKKEKEDDENYNSGLAIIDLSNLEIVRLFRIILKEKYLNPVELQLSLSSSTEEFVVLGAAYDCNFFLFTDDHSVVSYMGNDWDYNGTYILGLFDFDDYGGTPELIDVKTKKIFDLEEYIYRLGLLPRCCDGKIIGDEVVFWNNNIELKVPITNIVKNDFWGETTGGGAKLKENPPCRDIIKYEQLNEKVKKLVDTWDELPNGIRFKSLYDYIPVNSPVNASEQVWRVRRLIWDFKNDPNKISDQAHENAVNEIISQLRNIIKEEWITDGLELVCVPASTEMLSERRFAIFLQKFYYHDIEGNFEHDRHLHVIEEATPKHLGGTGHPMLSFDCTYFNGKVVILFDDIVTTGSSLLRMKNMLEQLGAYVVGAITIGRTASVSDAGIINGVNS